MTQQIVANSVPKPITVTLKQVAAWDLDHLDAPQCNIKASVPLLQRGLVWSPDQVELLWDSILRGFPIGSLVVSDKVDKQERNDTSKSGITHHLLDGQQRANAITLGFHDPFSENIAKVRGNKSESILWIDLAPLGTARYPDSQFPKDSTREFLIRVTTLAHPWGYQPNDNASRISASDARDAISFEYGQCLQEQRPSSLDLLPWRANAPVPLSWLLDKIRDTQDNLREQYEFWRLIKNRLAQESTKHKWPSLALEVLEQGHNTANLTDIYLAISRAMDTHLIIMVAPKNILAASRQEKSAPRDINGNIASIEHLFNRLNRQGTALNGEELAYSMIKAYWPDIAVMIDSVKLLRFPKSHLASLGVRAALTHPNSSKLVRGIGIPRLRAIAYASPPNQGEKTSTEYESRIQIEKFLGEKDRLVKACEKVDDWLIYHPVNSRNGLPPVLVSSFTRGSSDIYLFLLHIADNLENCDLAQNCEWRNLLPGLATLIHWFSKDDKLAIADILMEAVAGGISTQNVRVGITTIINNKLIYLPCHPDEVEKFIKIPQAENLRTWKWWQSLIEVPNEDERTQLQNTWKPFLERTAWERELLLFAQRDFLYSKFYDYDPSRKDLWENHNRPWDFDHLHAGSFFWGKQGVYAEFCRQWGNCIGNLRAWPFQDNRSDQQDTAKQKLSGKADEMKWSLIQSETELDALSHGDSTRHDPPAAAIDLSATIKARFIRIYSDWYSSTGMEQLLAPKSGD